MLPGRELGVRPGYIVDDCGRDVEEMHVLCQRGMTFSYGAVRVLSVELAIPIQSIRR